MVPLGVYLSGTIWLKDNVNLHLEEGAVIKGSPDIDDYCAADCCPQNEAEIKGGDYISGGHLVTVLSGHNHVNKNFRYSPEIIEHNVEAICGTCWDAYHCKDGTPRGYMV